MSTHPHRRALRVALTIASAPLLLGACSAEGIAEKASEKALEDSGVEGAEIDIDGEEGEIKIGGDDGDFDLSTGGELPDGFPKDIPLAAGDVIASQSVNNGGEQAYLVQIRAASSAGVYEGIESELTAAGYTNEGDQITSENSDRSVVGGTFSKGSTSVVVSVLATAEETTVSYSVSTS